MKGIAHFAVGVAATSCFPAAVEAGAAGNPLYFLLGGVFGLLPDTLDFKIYRFFYRRDIEVIPDPNAPNAQVIADAVACAVDRAARTGRETRIKLNTVRLAADRWQQYEVKFDVPNSRIVVTYGPRVTTDKRPAPGPQPEAGLRAAAPLPHPVEVEYLATSTIDIFDGPLFAMARGPDGRVRVSFIPWHREWSHSLVIGLVCALAGWAVAGWLAGAVILAAYSGHVLADQLGFLGSNLLYPFTRHRTPGLQRFRSGDAAPNLFFTWGSAVVILWNLYRYAQGPAYVVGIVQALCFGLLIPMGLILGLRRWFRARGWR